MSENSSQEQEAREDIASYEHTIEQFETHDLGDELEEMPQAHFAVSLPPRPPLYSLDAELSRRLQAVARQHSLSPERLLNRWVQEKLSQDVDDEKAAEILTVGAAE